MKGFFIMHKILCLGLVLFLSSGCLPRIASLPSQDYSEHLPAQAGSPSLFTPTELEELFSQPTAPPQVDPMMITSSSSEENQVAFLSLELPISDESSDNFYLEIIPGNQPRGKKEFDIPIVINEKVEYFLNYFQTRARNNFSNWLARSEKYVPFMRETLKENGLPEDLVYMALIESGFNPYAYSRAKAMGPWQFIYLTGKRYGLKVNWWVDERRDPEKSTVAAAKYLKDLYDMFACWYLAAAGYNAGENKIANGIKKYRTEDFWELTKYRYLKQETKHYVPQMIAAALIAKDPEKHGFVDIEYQEPLRYDTVKVPPAIDLRIIAKACEITTEELKELNPELKRWCTPPDSPGYEIKIPAGRTALFLKNFEGLQPREKNSFRTYVVKNGDNLRRIASLHRVDMEPLLEINRLGNNSRPSAGTTLLIPLPKEMAAKSDPPGPKSRHEGNGNGKSHEIIYTIKKGDSLWSIANETGVNIGALSSWNQLHPEAKLMPGDQLKVRVMNGNPATTPSQDKKEKREMIYVVKSGDSLWSIANRYNVTIKEIQDWNNLSGTDRIYPSAKLRLWVGQSNS